MTSIEDFLEWQRRQGIKVLQSKSGYWYQAGPRVYQAFPYHLLIDPDEEELDELMQQNGIIALRYSTAIDRPIGHISYHVVLENSGYELANLGKSTRRNIRYGLANCTVEPISLEQLAVEGWRLQHDTLIRQGRHFHETEETWRVRCQTAAQFPGVQAWGAFVKGTLAASLITYSMQDWIYLLYQQSEAKYLHLNVNNALSFSVTKYFCDDPQVKFIFYGLHSLDAPARVDEFKYHMGYTPKPVRQRVVFNKRVSWLVNPITHGLVYCLGKLYPASSTLAKTEGILRFYLEGQKPIEQQSWPKPLEDQREFILSGNGKAEYKVE